MMVFERKLLFQGTMSYFHLRYILQSHKALHSLVILMGMLSQIDANLKKVKESKVQSATSSFNQVLHIGKEKKGKETCNFKVGNAKVLKYRNLLRMYFQHWIGIGHQFCCLCWLFLLLPLLKCKSWLYSSHSLSL